MQVIEKLRVSRVKQFLTEDVKNGWVLVTEHLLIRDFPTVEEVVGCY